MAIEYRSAEERFQIYLRQHLVRQWCVEQALKWPLTDSQINSGESVDILGRAQEIFEWIGKTIKSE